MDTSEHGTRPRAFAPELAHTLPLAQTPPGWDTGPERRSGDGITLARGLAWFSIGLGLAEVLAPGAITRFLGVDDERSGLVRAYGFRELASGVGILAQRRPAAGVWSRVAGDVVDLGTLGTALTDEDAHRGRVIGALAMVAGVTALDVLCARQLGGRDD
jgi:hypothetical protein